MRYAKYLMYIVVPVSLVSAFALSSTFKKREKKTNFFSFGCNYVTELHEKSGKLNEKSVPQYKEK